MPSLKTSKHGRPSEPHGPPRPVERNLNETDFKHEIFTQWSRECGVMIQNVKPASLPGRGVGLVATAEIEKDARILFVPEKAMFKPNASRLGKSVFNDLQKHASPQALLSICLAAELDGESTALSKWKATWPTREELLPSLPLNWSSDMRDLLPQSVKPPLQKQQEEYRNDLENWLSTNRTAEACEQDFKYYWAIVNSRSFHFKPAGAKPVYTVLCPFIDYLNHGPGGTGVIVKQTPKGYEVTADRDYDEGEEILATYGAHPNDKLLLNYGFINTPSPGALSDDDIRLDHLLLPALGEATCNALEDVGFLGGYALLPETNEICFKTQVAVRAKLLTANKWKYFIANGEDRSGDCSGQVREFVIEQVMDPFLREAESRLVELEELHVGSRGGRTRNAEKQVALGLLKERWLQICNGVKGYIDDDRTV